MEMLPYIGGVAVGAILSVVGYVFARKSGLTPLQSEYIAVMKATNAALSERLALLEASRVADKAEIANLKVEVASQRTKVQRLERTVAELAAENSDLRRQLRLPARQAEEDSE